jgi:hypothetical protein
MMGRVWPLLLLAACGRIGFGSDGPRFLFHLDDLSDHTVVEVSGQNGYAFTLADFATVPGVLGGALHFDGSPYNSFVILPSTNGSCGGAPDLYGSVTIAAWMSLDSLHDWGGYTLGDVAVMQGSVGGTQGVWGLGATNGCGPETIGFEVAFDQTARFVRCGTTTLQTGTWYFVTGVYDASARTVQVYLDGADDTGSMAPSSSAIGTSLNPQSLCPYLGAPGNQSHMLYGSLDEVSIYDRALSASELAQLYTLSGG